MKTEESETIDDILTQKGKDLNRKDSIKTEFNIEVQKAQTRSELRT